MMELIARLERDDMDHWWRLHLACRTCGQGYFYEFSEQVDFLEGNDPQLTLFVPIESDADVAQYQARQPGSVPEAERFFRCYWPAKGEKLIGWVDRKQGS